MNYASNQGFSIEVLRAKSHATKMANGKLKSIELTATLKLKLIAEISIGVRLKNEKNWVSKMNPYTNSLSLNPFIYGNIPH